MSTIPPSTPDVRELAMPEEPPGWPKVVGIISIVWACIGLLGSVCGLASPLIFRAMSAQMEQQMGGPMPPPMLPSPAQLGLMGVGMLWAVLLLAAGIATVTRKGAGRPMHIAYAVLSILTSVPALALGVKQQQEMADWRAANPSSPWSKQSPAGAVIGMGCGMVLGLGYPIFCLAWFAPKKHSPDANAPQTDVV